LGKFWSMSIKLVTPFLNVLSIPLGLKKKMCIYGHPTDPNFC
jgi:hypothetical protein